VPEGHPVREHREPQPGVPEGEPLGSGLSGSPSGSQLLSV
jgi:hypothetical protein